MRADPFTDDELIASRHPIRRADWFLFASFITFTISDNQGVAQLIEVGQALPDDVSSRILKVGEGFHD